MNLSDLPDDVLEIIRGYLREYYMMRLCGRELRSNHIQRSLRSIQAQRVHHWSDPVVHPGRDIVRIIRPKMRGFVGHSIPVYYGEEVNLHGLIYRKQYRYLPHKLEGTHADLDAVLESLGHKRFKSKLRQQKIHMLMKSKPLCT